MSTDFQEYKNRVHYKGGTKREYVKTKVAESISSLIEDSQYGFTIDVKQDDGEYKAFDVAILSTKTTQEYEAANIIAPLEEDGIELGLKKGTLFRWNDDNWLMLKQMFRPDQPGFNGIAYRCTWDLKWIDEKDNTLHIQPAYVRSGRITNALGVTPDVNRVFDNLVLHDTDWNMMAATQLNLDLHPEMRFIIKGQAYRVTNVDNVSIDNVSIISFKDDKLLDTDDRENGIAYSDVYKYSIKSDLGDTIELFANDIREIPVTILEDGNPVEEEYFLTSSNEEIVEVNGSKIIGRGLGKTTITIALAKNEYTVATIDVNVSEDHIPQEEKIYIVGDDYIEWNKSQTYKLSCDAKGMFGIEKFSKIRADYKFADDGSSITISIKDKYSGTFEITAETTQGVVSKTVYIRTV